MLIFIDESGTFAGSSGTHSISVVGALIIPEGCLSNIERKYSVLRRQLPKQSGEVKGRLLSEADVDRVVSLLTKNEALFEITAIDMGLHDETDIVTHKQGQEEGITKHLTDDFHPSVQEGLWNLRRRLERMPHQLYVQSVATFELIARVIEHAVMFFSQRRPEELGAFYWVVDGKDRDRITDWEDWWSFVVMPSLQSKSLRKPMGMFTEGDYSHFRRFGTVLSEHLKPHVKDPSKDHATDLRKLLTEHFRFSTEPEPCLEMVDILTNATRRALMGRLRIKGWGNIRRLMIHRPEHYIQFIALKQTPPKQTRYPYLPVLKYFSQGGKNMLAPRFLNP